jgi:hypothetical protein
LFRDGTVYGVTGKEKIPRVHENDVHPFAP